MGVKRARTEEQQQQRRQVLLDTAWKLFQDKAYEAINMAEVAQAAGLAKGTVYLYFETKEALFLAILEQQIQAWFRVMNARLVELAGGNVSGKNRIEEVATLICTSLGERPAIARLFAILHLVLEHNIDYDTASQFKRMLLQQIVLLGTSLEACLPFLRAGEGAQLAMRFYTFVLGLQQVANPAPMIRDIIGSNPDMVGFAIDFPNECAAVTYMMLRGLEAIANSGQGT